MVVLLNVFAVMSFAFGVLMASMLRSDIQVILMMQGFIGGCVFVGMAAILKELRRE